MSISKIEAMRIYEDYHCRGNSMHTSVETMAEIVYLYKDQLSAWQENISEHDETYYDFDDDEFINYKKEGKEKAKENTGYDDNAWDKTKQYGGAAADVAKSVGNVVAKEALKETGGKVVEKVAVNAAEKAADKAIAKFTEKAASGASEKVVQNAATKAGEKAATSCAAKTAGEKGVEEAAGSAAFIIGCTLGAATAALYWAKRTNKDQVDASAEVANVMNDGMAELSSTQTEMQNMSEELTAAAEEAEQINEEANQQILELKTAFDDSRQARKDIQTKAESGKITADDKRRYEEYSSDMEDAGDEITNVTDDASTVVGNIQSDMSTYQEGFDAAAETMGTINGVTDYAAGFDSSTEVLCYVEMGAQTLNVTTTGYATYQAAAFAASGSWAFGATAWAWAFVALGAAGSIGSLAAAAEQYKWAKDVHNEIDVRKSTEELNTNTLDVYNVEIDNYDSALDDVSSLELNLPEDLTIDDTTLNVPEEGKEVTQTPKKQQNIK